MNRANSIKKAVRRVIEMTEEAFKKSKKQPSNLPDPNSIRCSTSDRPPRISPNIKHKPIKQSPPGILQLRIKKLTS